MLFSIPGVENLSQTTVTIVALVLALVLVAFFGLILRRLTSGRLSLKSDRGRARQPRLGIVDVYDLDRQRQLILLRRDNVEHLLLVGGPNDVVVETNIVRAGGSRQPVTPVDAQDRADPTAERSVEIAPVRPVLEPLGLRAAEPVAARLGSADATTRGAIEPALKPSSISAAPARRPADRGTQANGGTPPGGGITPGGSAALSGEPGAEITRVLSVGGQPRQTSPAAETGRPDMAKQLEEALARPAPEPRPAPARTLELPRATPVAQPGRLMSAFRKTEPNPAPAPAPNGRSEPAPPAIEPVSASAAGPVDIDTGAAEADVRREPVRQQDPARPDVARQQPGSIEAEQGLSERDPGERSLDVGVENVLPDPVREDHSRDDMANRAESETSDVPASPPAPAEQQVRSFPRPVQAAAPANPILVPPVQQPFQAPSTARNDPFSIEDIEAEFARLLGRPVDKRDDRT